MAEDEPKRLPFAKYDPRPRRAVVTPDGVSTFEFSSPKKYPPGTRVLDLRQEPRRPWRTIKRENDVVSAGPPLPEEQLDALARGFGELLADLVLAGKIVLPPD